MINKIHKLLQIKNYTDAYSLLRNASIDVEDSSNYGKGGLYCYIATIVVYLPLLSYEKITSDEKLKSLVNKQILECARLVEPPKDYGSDIKYIRYEYDDKLDKNEIEIQTSKLQIIDHDYLLEQIKKVNEKVGSNDFDGAITNSRTIVESVLLYILEKSGEDTKYDGNLVKLYKSVSKLLNPDPVIQSSDSIKQILTGLITIINGLSCYRNEFSDAHGKSNSQSINLKKRHAMLAINCAMTISDYILNYIDDKDIV